MLLGTLAAWVMFTHFGSICADAEPIYGLRAPTSIQVPVKETFVLAYHIKYCDEDFPSCPSCRWTFFLQVNRQAHCVKIRTPGKCFEGTRTNDFRTYHPGVHVAKMFMVPYYLKCQNYPASNLTQRIGELAVGKVTVGDVYGPPDVTRISDVTQTSAIVTWTLPKRSGSGELLSFIVEYGSTQDKARRLRAEPGSNKVQLEGLKSGRAYFVNIRAENVVGRSEPSATITFNTKGASDDSALDSTKLALLIAVGILGVLVVVLLLMIAGHFLRRRRKRNSTNQESVINNDNHSRKKFVLPLPKKQNGTDKKDPDNQKARFSIRSPEEPPPRPPKNYGKAEQSVKNSGKVPKATRAQSVPDARTVATLPRSRAQDDSFAAENESKKDNSMKGRPLPLSPAKLEVFEVRQPDDEKRRKSDTKPTTPQPVARSENASKQKNGPAAQIRKPAPLPKPNITADPKEKNRLSAAPPASDDCRLGQGSPIPSPRRFSAPNGSGVMFPAKSDGTKIGELDTLDEDLYYVELVET